MKHTKTLFFGVFALTASFVGCNQMGTSEDNPQSNPDGSSADLAQLDAVTPTPIPVPDPDPAGQEILLNEDFDLASGTGDWDVLIGDFSLNGDTITGSTTGWNVVDAPAPEYAGLSNYSITGSFHSGAANAIGMLAGWRNGDSRLGIYIDNLWTPGSQSLRVRWFDSAMRASEGIVVPIADVSTGWHDMQVTIDNEFLFVTVDGDLISPVDGIGLGTMPMFDTGLLSYGEGAQFNEIRATTATDGGAPSPTGTGSALPYGDFFIDGNLSYTLTKGAKSTVTIDEVGGMLQIMGSKGGLVRGPVLETDKLGTFVTEYLFGADTTTAPGMGITIGSYMKGSDPMVVMAVWEGAATPETSKWKVYSCYQTGLNCDYTYGEFTPPTTFSAGVSVSAEVDYNSGFASLWIDGLAVFTDLNIGTMYALPGAYLYGDGVATMTLDQVVVTETGTP